MISYLYSHRVIYLFFSIIATCFTDKANFWGSYIISFMFMFTTYTLLDFVTWIGKMVKEIREEEEQEKRDKDNES